MQFTEEEMKIVSWLRRQHAAWPTNRLIILIGSLLSAIGFAIGFSKSGWESNMNFFLILAVAGASYTLGSWSGRPEVSLLLKLVEHNQSSNEPNNSFKADSQPLRGRERP